MQNLSFILNADVTGAESLTLDGEPITLPHTVTPEADHTYTLVATGPGGTATATLTIDLPAVVTTQHQERDEPCGEDFTGTRHEERTVTLHDGVPVDDPPWIETSNTCVPIPPPPAPLYPVWRNGKVRFEWVRIDGTAWAYRNKDYFADLGLLIPAQRAAPKTNYMHWGTNKLGQTCIRGLNDKYTSENYGYHGMALDRRDSTIFVGSGDAEYPDNSYFKLKLEADAPSWQLAVLGTHSSEYKHTINNTTGEWSSDGGPYTLRSEHMNGDPRGGHMYWNQELLINYQGKDYIVHWYSNQFYDTDSGNDARVRLADLQTQRWLPGKSLLVQSLDNPLGSGTLFVEGDTRPCKVQHPVTQDEYMFRGDFLYRWNFATNNYVLVFNFRPLWGQWGVDKLSMALNWEENYLLCEGNVSSAHATRVTFILDLNTPSGANLATYIPITVAGAAAAKWNVSKYGAVVWCPDLQKFIQYKNDTENKVYSITRTAAAEVTVEEVLTTGQTPPALHVWGGLGGLLNKFRYAPNLHGMVCMLQTRDPVYFLVTE